MVLAGALAVPQEPPPPVFSAVAESVYLDVFVTRDGEPVHGLTADDFEVRDAGRRVSVDLVPTDAVPLSTILVLDTSLSVSGAKLDELRRACDAFARGLGPRDEALLLTFSNAVRLRVGLGEDRSALETALAETRAGGRTALFDAVFTSLVMAPTLPGRPAVVVFSDGVDTVSWTGGPDALALARESSTLVYAVGIASALLQEVVDATGGRTISGPRVGIESGFLRVLRDLRERYLLRFDSDGTPGFRPLEVKLKRTRADLRYRPGYVRRPSQ
jgi:VWFA-related protein